MFKVKIYGAGSIGNHLAHASRRLGWDVVVCDTDPAALERMRTQIYPQRYGAWDSGIQLCSNREAPVGGFDLVVIGTPPEWHVPLALQSLDETPRALLIEKPLSGPDLDPAGELWRRARASSTHVFVGYDHAVGRAARIASDWIRSGRIGTLRTIDVDFREHWGGIFAAHPWLQGPSDTYLGFWQRGGGSLGEHSHGIHLWQHLAHAGGAGRVSEVSASVHYVNTGQVHYDELAFLTLRTESGLTGRVVQDVITAPTQKRARVQGTLGILEWVAGVEPGIDAVTLTATDGSTAVERVRKTRPDDFIEELRYIEGQLRTPHSDPALSLSRGLDTLLVIAAAHRAERERAAIRLLLDQEYGSQSLAAPTPV
ncbi:MAG: Gfo/Idh/MocA family protein [Vicinamibacterales bacterium]